MNVIIIETHNEDGVEWGVSLTDHNPTSENYIGCKDYESANKLKNLLAKLIPCVDLLKKVIVYDSRKPLAKKNQRR